MTETDRRMQELQAAIEERFAPPPGEGRFITLGGATLRYSDVTPEQMQVELRERMRIADQAIERNRGSFEGTLVLPAASDVRMGVEYGGGQQNGATMANARAAQEVLQRVQRDAFASALAARGYQTTPEQATQLQQLAQQLRATEQRPDVLYEVGTPNVIPANQRPQPRRLQPEERTRVVDLG